MNANVSTVALSIHPGWSRQCDPIKNFADKKVGLNRGQIFANDLIVEPQTKLASRSSPGVSSSMTIRSTDILSRRLMLTILPHAIIGEVVRLPTVYCTQDLGRTAHKAEASAMT